MDSVIRKISIGSDYKNDAMHYSVGQEVYGGHQICDILLVEDGSYNIYIKKNQEILYNFHRIIYFFSFIKLIKISIV